MSNSLDPDQDRRSVSPDLGETVCRGYRQMTKVAASKERVNNIWIFFMLQEEVIEYLTSGY